MSEVVNNTNTADTSNNNSADTNNDTEYVLTDEQHRLIDILARERVIEEYEAKILERENRKLAQNLMNDYGFSEIHQEDLMGVIEFADHEKFQKTMSIINEICETKAANLVNERLRGREVPKAGLPFNTLVQTKISTFGKEVQNLKSR